MTRYEFREHDSAKGVCDRCGFVFNLSSLRKEWTGLKVCHGPGSNNCWEPRHPQDFVRGVPDRQAVFDPRPEPPDTFLTSYLLREDGSPYFREFASGSTAIRREV